MARAWPGPRPRNSFPDFSMTETISLHLNWLLYIESTVEMVARATGRNQARRFSVAQATGRNQTRRFSVARAMGRNQTRRFLVARAGATRTFVDCFDATTRHTGGAKSRAI